MAVQSFCIIYFQGKRIGEILESEALKKTLEKYPGVIVLRWTTFDQSTIERAVASYPERCVPFTWVCQARSVLFTWACHTSTVPLRWVCETSTLRDLYPSDGYVKQAP